MKDFSYITNSHPSFIENLYQDFVKDPNSVDPDLKKFFEGFDFAVSNGSVAAGATTPSGDGAAVAKEFSVYQLIDAYRKKAHLISNTNPIRPRKDRQANLELKYFGLSDADLNTNFQAGQFIGMPGASLKSIIARLKKVYASTVGIETSYINNPERAAWLQEAVEEKLWKKVETIKKGMNK